MKFKVVASVKRCASPLAHRALQQFIKWLETVGFLADAMSHLNNLNVELRGVKHNFI